MRSIYVIGNGFDLYHKLKTSYCDFYTFLKSNDNKFPSISNWSILELLNQLETSGIDLWTNIEEAFGETDFSELVTFYNFSDDDLDERESDRQSERAYYLGEDLEELGNKRFYNAIAFAMNQWLEEAYHKCFPIKVYNELLNNVTDAFVNFNYTPTLEDTYKIPHENILHIHGQTHWEKYCEYKEQDYWRYPDAWLDYGYGVSSVKYRSKLNSDEALAFSRISNLYTEFKKTTRESRLEEFIGAMKFNSFVIIGHSLGDVDMPYFSLINNHLTANASITMFLYERDWKKEEEFKTKLEYFIPRHPISFIKYEDDDYEIIPD